MRSRPFGASELALLRDLIAAGDPVWDVSEILSRPPAAVRAKMREIGLSPADVKLLELASADEASK
jgi:hypothetical protein